MYLFPIFLFTVPLAFASEDTHNVEHCDPVQNAEYGTSATIECIFEEGFYGVFWFNSTDYINQFPLVTLKESVKGGDGYESGEFDISAKGSLIINEVLLRHEHNYTVFKLDSVDSKIEPHFIFLNVTVTLMKHPCKSKQFLELGKTGFLECSFTKPLFGIFWFDSVDHRNKFPVVMLKDSVKSGNGYESGEYDISPHGSLIIEKVSSLHEKTFTVYKLENVDSKVEPIFIDVHVYALPNPLHPVINDCHHQQCLVETLRKGRLRCAVNGIRPIVKLLWESTTEEPPHAITFYDHNYTIETKDDVYDVALTSYFVVNDTSVPRLDVECGIIFEERSDLFNLTSKVLLLFPTDNIENESSDATSINKTWIAAVVVVPSLLMCIVISTVIYLKTKGPPKDEDIPDGTNVELLQSNDKRKENKNEVIQQLINHYKEIYSNFPYFQLRAMNSKVPAEFCKSLFNVLMNSEGGKNRKPLAFCCFFSEPSFKGNTFVLQGDSGCGKTCFAQQLAYDWSDNPEVSTRQCIEILIILPFRKFRNGTSMYKAIKQIYLFENSSIDESQVEAVLTESSHVMIILEGYDEYPQDIVGSREILKSVMSQKRDNFTVIITTRSSLEKDVISNDIQEINLLTCSNFEEDISLPQGKGPNMENLAESIGYNLETNPFLAYLCNFPLFLFYFMDAFILKERKIESVSGFLEGILIRSQEQSRRSRPTKQYSNVNELCNENYLKLGKDAFSDIKRATDAKVWPKEDITKKIGAESLEALRQDGILIEETVTVRDDELTLYLKFCHTLFHELFAANYISNKIKRDGHYNKENFQDNLMFGKESYYFHLFVLELSERAVVEEMLKLLDDNKDFREFLILFKMSNVEFREEALNLIDNFVSKGVKLSFEDGRVKQQFIISIMEIASRNQKPIKSLKLKQTLSSAEISSNKLYLKSNLLLPVLASLKVLCIEEKNKRLNEEETVSVIKFAAKCGGVEHLRFSHCILPFKFGENVLPVTTATKLTVTWAPVSSRACYILCSSLGRWRRETSENLLTEGEIQIIERSFQHLSSES